MDNIGRLVVTTFITYRFIIIPTFLVLLPLSQIILRKSTIKRLGIIIISSKEKEPPRKIKVLNILLLFFGIYFIFHIKLAGFFYTSIAVFQILDNFAIIKYKNCSGIYEEGLLINKESYFWKDLHSWKFKEKNKVFEILNSKGYRFDIYFNDSQAAIDYLKTKLREED